MSTRMGMICRSFPLALTALALALALPSSAQACGNEMFRAGAGAHLPDCRAYERASPAEKNGGAVEGFPGLLTASSDGSSVTFFTQAGTGIPAPGGAPSDFSTYLSNRRGETWGTQRLMPPQYLGQKAHYLGATRNQRFAYFEVLREGNGRGLFILDTNNETVQTIVSTSANPEGAEYAIDGASADGARVLFETRAPLASNVAPFTDNVYLWSRTTGAVTLVGVLPGEAAQAPAGGSFGGAHEWFFGEEPYSGGALSGLGVEALNAITPDASQIYFTAGETGQIYLRRGLVGPDAESIRISRPNPGVVDANGEKPAAFQEATPDGTMAFFLSAGKLTADANTGPTDEGRDLYRWDSATNTLIDIAPDATDELGAQVQGLLGVSEKGTSGYFVAKGALAAGSQAGASNLYRFDAAATPTAIEYIATLQSGSPITRLPDALNWSPRAFESSFVSIPTFARSSRVSPDGTTLIFSSVQPLTGYDNTNPTGSECSPEEIIPHRCGELFRYSHPAGSFGKGSLVCISCDPSGAGPVGSAHFQSSYLNGGTSLPEGNPEVNIPLNLSASGDEVFFESPDSLVPADTNGNSGCPNFSELAKALPACQDVYEWEAVGTPGGSCEVAEVTGGCLYLLSTGKSDAPSFFAGASADGRVAFIVTSSQLVPSDTDSAADAYAVRVDGGIADQFRSPAALCAGEDCLASPAGPPSQPDTGSANIVGSSNVKNKSHRHKKQHHHKRIKRKKPKHRHKRANHHRNAGSHSTKRDAQ